jgi:hypothetical protein
MVNLSSRHLTTVKPWPPPVSRHEIGLSVPHIGNTCLWDPAPEALSEGQQSEGQPSPALSTTHQSLIPSNTHLSQTAVHKTFSTTPLHYEFLPLECSNAIIPLTDSLSPAEKSQTERQILCIPTPPATPSPKRKG